MIDIHSHILPGLDDGADSMEEAVAMARCAVACGIRQMVATPHVKTGLYPNKREAILTAIAQLQETLLANKIPLDILPGAEYHLDPDLAQRLTRGEILTINDRGRYLLVELPAAVVPDYTATVFYELQLLGVTPVIAHPERNAVFARDHSRLHMLVTRGALAQVTAGSLAGLFGHTATATARAFLEQGCVHFIASDAHASTGRIQYMEIAIKEATRLLGEEPGRNFVAGNPDRVVKGEPIEASEIRVITPARRSLLGFFKKTNTRR
jgi:protein-tyrosine phosphatase